jgi:hypothetical protein
VNTSKLTSDFDQDRRRFLGAAVVAAGAAGASFASPQQINAGVLNVGYAEAGPAVFPVGHNVPQESHGSSPRP